MYKIMIMFLLISCSISSFFVIRQKEVDAADTDQGVTIVLDAGHGGYDSGSIGLDGQLEKDITLSITLCIAEQLTQAGYSVVYTRTSDDVDWPSDNLLDLKSRVEKGVNADADYFVSIHTNSCDEGIVAYGFETFVDLSDPDMVDMATSIHDHLNDIGYSFDRGLKDGIENQLYVICSNPVPAMLIEVGFITDEDDLWSMTHSQQSLAEAIAQGIITSIETQIE